MKNNWSLKLDGHCIQFEGPIVMGILNATPDSFYNQGRESHIDALLQTADTMLAAGATILDLGGMSTRPGAAEIDTQTECNRIIPVLNQLKKSFPRSFLSVDTYRTEVAEKAILHGAHIINDISGGTFEPAILPVVSKAQVPFICMHTLGKPAMMQRQPHYNNVVSELKAYFMERVDTLTHAGINNIIIDPGFGFGKTLQHNYQLLHALQTFTTLQKPILVGLSRKSMIYKPLNISANEALNGTSALHMHALKNGANILRVHDVAEAVQCIQLHRLLEAAATD
jgi:dihydropteroate synthase